MKWEAAWETPKDIISKRIKINAKTLVKKKKKKKQFASNLEKNNLLLKLKLPNFDYATQHLKHFKHLILSNQNRFKTGYNVHVPASRKDISVKIKTKIKQGLEKCLRSLKTLVAFAGEPCLIPSTHLVAQSHL